MRLPCMQAPRAFAFATEFLLSEKRPRSSFHPQRSSEEVSEKYWKVWSRHRPLVLTHSLSLFPPGSSGCKTRNPNTNKIKSRLIELGVSYVFLLFRLVKISSTTLSSMEPSAFWILCAAFILACANRRKSKSEPTQHYHQHQHQHHHQDLPPFLRHSAALRP